MNCSLLRLRQRLLKWLVPEKIWPRLVELNGTSIPVRNMPFSFGVKQLLASGRYEFSERMLCAQFLERGMNVLEMGASIGILSAVIAEKIGIKGRLVSVEASESKAKIAKEWLSLRYNNITYLQGIAFPCWELPPGLSVAGFNESSSSLGGNAVYKVSANQNNSTSLTSYNIKLLEEIYFDRPIDALVIDIEGGEEILLSDSAFIPDSIRYLVIELHPHEYAQSESEQRIIEEIVRNGFNQVFKIGTSHLFESSRYVDSEMTDIMNI